jgi:hypothetical protein
MKVIQMIGHRLASISFNSVWGIAVFALLVGPMMLPQNAEASGNVTVYLWRNSTTCAGNSSGLTGTSWPVSASQRQIWYGMHFRSFQRLGSTTCYSLP